MRTPKMQTLFQTGQKLGLAPLMGLILIAGPAAFAACTSTSLGDGWTNKPLDSVETTQFSIDFDGTPSEHPNNAFVGISGGSRRDEYAVLVRFNSSGNIDAINGNSYDAATKIHYSPGVTYHFELEVDVVRHTYSVFVTPPMSVTPPKGTRLTLGRNFSFQTSQKGVFGLNSFGVGSGGRNAEPLTACNVKVAAVTTVTPNPNCSLLVPDNPLTATGLATPYQLFATDPLQGPCDGSNGAQGAFVHGAIYDPNAHTISVYNPLVVNQSDPTPAIAPTPPTLPAGAVVALWFGFDGNNLLLTASSPSVLTGANCVNGNGASLFSQFSYCNAVNFFAAANADPTLLTSVPALGTSPMDGKTCPSPRDFSVVDQDQSDNVPTEYLISTANGRFSQNTAANRAAIGAGNFTKIGNPSDERLTAILMDPPLGCTPWTVPNLADPGSNVPSLPTNELQSAKFSVAPVALVPSNDPMTQTNGMNDLTKINLYRAGVNQAVAATLADADATAYCRNIRAVNATKLLKDKQWFAAAGSPAPTLADSLFTFLAMRYVTAYSILGCDTLLNQPVNLILTTNSGGVVTNARGTSR